MKIAYLLCAIFLVSTIAVAVEEQMLLELQHVVVTRPMAAAQRRQAVFKSNEETRRTFHIDLDFNSDTVGKNERNILMLLRQLPAGTKIGFMVSKKEPEKVAEWELSYLQIKKAEQPAAQVQSEGAPSD